MEDFHEITEKEYKLFCEKVRKCRNMFGISELLIFTETADLSIEHANAALYRDEHANRLNIYLSEDKIENNFNDIETDISYNAFHEVVEGGLLGDLACIANRNASPMEQKEIEKACHAIIHRLWMLLKDRVVGGKSGGLEVPKPYWMP